MRVDLFDPVTGEPRAWYRITAGGRVAFYDGPCAHVSGGARLRPVDRAALERWVRARPAAGGGSPERPQDALGRRLRAGGLPGAFIGAFGEAQDVLIVHVQKQWVLGGEILFAYVARHASGGVTYSSRGTGRLSLEDLSVTLSTLGRGVAGGHGSSSIHITSRGDGGSYGTKWSIRSIP